MQDKLSSANSLGVLSTLAMVPGLVSQQQSLVTTPPPPPPPHRHCHAPHLLDIGIGNSPAAKIIVFLETLGVDVGGYRELNLIVGTRYERLGRS